MIGRFFERDRDEGHATATNTVPPPVTPTPRPTPSPEPTTDITEPSVPSRFNFEDGAMGWKTQDQGNSRAWVQLAQSKERSKDGEFSLKVQTDLDGGDERKGSGEVWVDLRQNPPAGLKAPLDLSKRTLTAWVYASPGSVGDPSKPNGIQMFVKDKKWKAEYGTWQNLVEGQWNKISLTVGASQPEAGHLDSDFDPTQIIGVGVKLGAGGGSKARYRGAVYVDAVSW
jgi:hypothetical protein